MLYCQFMWHFGLLQFIRNVRHVCCFLVLWYPWSMSQISFAANVWNLCLISITCFKWLQILVLFTLLYKLQMQKTFTHATFSNSKINNQKDKNILIFARHRAQPPQNYILQPTCNCDSYNLSMLHDLASADQVYHVNFLLAFEIWGLSFEKRSSQTQCWQN